MGERGMQTCLEARAPMRGIWVAMVEIAVVRSHVPRIGALAFRKVCIPRSPISHNTEKVTQVCCTTLHQFNTNTMLARLHYSRCAQIMKTITPANVSGDIAFAKLEYFVLKT